MSAVTVHEPNPVVAEEYTESYRKWPSTVAKIKSTKGVLS